MDKCYIFIVYVNMTKLYLKRFSGGQTKGAGRPAPLVFILNTDQNNS